VGKYISTGSLKSLSRLLYAQRIKGFDAPTDPHLDEPAQATFESLLQKCEFYLEFGSGGSTVMADRLGIRGLSVECDRFYAAAVRNVLSQQSTIEIIDVDIGITREWGKPIARYRSKRRLAKWSRYSNAPFEILKQRGDFPDFVLIDGRFRRACALNTARHAIIHARSLTLLFDDYFKKQCAHYASIEPFLGRPQQIGRAAIFEISPATVPHAPAMKDVTAANTDFR
jgi:hypothetical protein